ncbi:ATP-grasp domain-containing protein [bacterium]|nr:ATP-grasp domain-containing protein [bacterium]
MRGTTGKSIMIFGAGLNQLELIRESHRLGLVTVVIDPQADPPGRPEADFFYRVEGDDYEATREVALRHKVSGIVTGQMEKPLRMMARLAQELGYAFNSPEVTERCLDKWLMKQVLLAHRVPCAKGVLLKPGDEIKLPEGMSYPVIIKPRDAFSSRGVYKCEDRTSAEAYIEESRSFSSTGDVIIEEFLSGKEYSVESLTFNGETTIVQFTEKFITPYPRTVEVAHLQPAEMGLSVQMEVSAVVRKALTALGVRNSASHTEVMVTEKGPVIIEVGARLGGDFIGSYLTRASTGMSMDRAAAEIATGVRPSHRPSSRAFSMIRYLELPEGKRVEAVLPTDDIMTLPGLVFAAIFVKPGDTIEPLTHSALRPGCVIAEAKMKDHLLVRIEEYARRLAEKIILK